MSLPGSIQSAPSGSLGFDADTVISSSVAQQFAQQGYQFCLRYLSLGAGEDPGDLSPQEAVNILTAGLGLMPVQHVRSPGWYPTGDLGQQDGANAGANALAVGFPPGVNVWCDLEGVNNSATAQQVIDYCTSWFNAVSAQGYVPGLYVGGNAILTGDQLYSNLAFQHYWQSCSEVPALPVRGYQMVQTLVQEPVNGIGIDKDVTQTDNEGGRALWLGRRIRHK
jgi:hypothetical protein